jgi:hypothetical protein
MMSMKEFLNLALLACGTGAILLFSLALAWYVCFELVLKKLPFVREVFDLDGKRKYKKKYKPAKARSGSFDGHDIDRRNVATATKRRRAQSTMPSVAESAEGVGLGSASQGKGTATHTTR